MFVEYDENVLKDQQIITAVINAGYNASIYTEGKNEDITKVIEEEGFKVLNIK